MRVLLQHTKENSTGCEDTKLIGVFESSAQAEHSKLLLLEKPGFCDSPHGFTCDAYEVGVTHWLEGFANGHN